jgi:hypothetical protein
MVMKNKAASLVLTIFGLLACAIGPDAAFASNIAGLTGSYTCVSNKNLAGFNVYELTAGTVGVNSLSTMNFDAGTLTGLINLVSNFGTSNVSTATSTLSASLTVGPGIFSGNYAINLSNLLVGGSPASAPGFYMTPANSNNTLFITSIPATTGGVPETGVCQKQ